MPRWSGEVFGSGRRPDGAALDTVAGVIERQMLEPHVEQLAGRLQVVRDHELRPVAGIAEPPIRPLHAMAQGMLTADIQLAEDQAHGVVIRGPEPPRQQRRRAAEHGRDPLGDNAVDHPQASFHNGRHPAMAVHGLVEGPVLGAVADEVVPEVGVPEVQATPSATDGCVPAQLQQGGEAGQVYVDVVVQAREEFAARRIHVGRDQRKEGLGGVLPAPVHIR
mmetsp:Transcript_95689/g.310039  ORF Transcript_95689/g.310039 Transcript_95689/m.310039 type:complete len:221 (+) Transcript_95689:38-700(+)